MDELKQIAKKIKDSDAVLIGASNGLSITEGLHLFADNQAFEDLFGDIKKKYGLRCILQGMSAQWPSEEEKWGFWSRLIHHYCGKYQESPVMSDLKEIVDGKDYFIITTNGECHFELSGFSPEKVYEVEGNWLTMQCACACHDTLYPSLDPAEKMAGAEKGGRVLSAMVPRCPKCGGPMQIHMETDQNFIPETKGRQRFEAFLEQYHGEKLVVLELGIGWRNQLIKAPLMRLVEREPNAAYVTINLGEVYITDNIKEKSFGLDGYLGEILSELKKECENYNTRSSRYQEKVTSCIKKQTKKRCCIPFSRLFLKFQMLFDPYRSTFCRFGRM